MAALDYAIIAAAGFAAGGVNTIVGSGSLITFPVLVSLGYRPLVANVSNTIGLVPGSASGAIGYRRELAGQKRRAMVLGACSAIGGLAGAILLVVFPSSFQAVVPFLVLLAVALVIVQPRLARHLTPKEGQSDAGRWWLRVAVMFTGIYGGYFGAAQGVLLIGLLALGIDDRLQRLNGLKNVLAGLVNGIASVLFIFVAPVAWAPAVIIAVSSTVGAQVGAKFGRKLPAPVLRGAIVVAGTAVAIKLLVA